MVQFVEASMGEKKIKAFRQNCLKALEPYCINAQHLVAEIDLLFNHCLSLTPERFWALSDAEEMTDLQCDRINQLLQKRMNDRVPIQYLLGYGYFYGLSFKVTPDVLIPRPETELLVEAVLKFIQQHPKEASFSILELGVGSGCAITTLTKQFKKDFFKESAAFHIVGTDISSEALVVAQENTKTHEVDTDIKLLTSDWFSDIPQQKFDVIYSNPPYVSPELKETIRPEVIDHEPHLALFSDGNGLESYKAIAAGAKPYLKPHGQVVVEIGDGMADSVIRVFETENLKNQQIIKDLSGTDRVLVFTCPKSL